MLFALDTVASLIVKLDTETEELALTIRRVKFFMKVHYRESQMVKVNVVLKKMVVAKAK